ncbi:MAG: hypothetical protein COA85_06275 [Robiginitomaculum sp.]|nr:MAG: hypothetical protein COA85_06275 [Robiginitomaculum sp.]
MKVTGQSSLIAAQQLGVQRTNAEAKAASAAFFSELKKAAPTARTNATVPVSSPQTSTAQSVTHAAPMREAPLRATAAGTPLPPGSLLNIIV